MWNKFKLWLNRNDFKILTIILIIIGIYLLIKGSNSYFKNENKSKNDNTIQNEQNISVFDDIQYSEEDLNKIEKSEDDYTIITRIQKKFINTIYKATKNNDDSAKQDLINMCSTRFIDNLTTPRRTITTENILTYLMGVNNIEDYSIENIYKYGESNNVAKYIVDLKFDDGKAAVINSYMIINIDRNNKTFSYGGNAMDLNYVYENSGGDYGNIENKGSNTY